MVVERVVRHHPQSRGQGREQPRVVAHVLRRERAQDGGKGLGAHDEVARPAEREEARPVRRRAGGARATCTPSAASVRGAKTYTSRTPELASVASAKSMKRYLPAKGVSAAAPGDTRGSRLALPPPATTTPSSRPSIEPSFVPPSGPIAGEPALELGDECAQPAVDAELGGDRPAPVHERRMIASELPGDLDRRSLAELPCQVHR